MVPVLIALGLVTVVALLAWVCGWDELRPAIMGERLVEEFAGGAMREVDECLRVFAPVVAACSGDDRRELNRRFGAAVHDFYWGAITVDELWAVTDALVVDGEHKRVWF